MLTNLFANLPEDLGEEIFEPLLKSGKVLIERIVSYGHSSPAQGWYDQAQEEWVVLLKGEAKIRLRENDELVHLQPGDFLHLPAHCCHRVEWTVPDTETIWLAVHISESEKS